MSAGAAVAAGFTFFTWAGKYLTEPSGWSKLTREEKLKDIREGLDHAIDNNDLVSGDHFMQLYRQLFEHTGP